jgi:hypothetical protein
MSQQPPEWFRQPRGPRIGCADVTIVSIASIAAFILLIFVVLRPGSISFIDITGSNNVTVGAVRATDTPGGLQTPFPTGAGGAVGPSGTGGPTGTSVAAATVAIINTPVPPTATAAPPTPTVPPTPAFHLAKLLDTCRLRQEPSYQAQVIQVFPKGSSFKIYDEQQKVKDPSTGAETNWQKVEPDDNSNRQGWMVVECY